MDFGWAMVCSFGFLHCEAYQGYFKKTPVDHLRLEVHLLCINREGIPGAKAISASSLVLGH